MDFSQSEVSPIRRYGGLSIVVLLHVLVAYALVTGLARKMVDVIKQPVETKIIEEVKPPPPPEMPPPPPPPKMTAPPPPFIPPPEINIQTAPAPTITRTTTPAPTAPQEFKPTAPPVQAPAGPTPAPVAAPKGPTSPAQVDFNACKPEYPRAAQAAEEEGTVKLQVVIGVDGQVVGTPTIIKSSGSRILDKAAVNGVMSQCKGKPAYKDGKPVESTQPVEYHMSIRDE